MAGLKFDITGDNTNMLSALQGVQNGVRNTKQTIEQSGEDIGQFFKKIETTAAVAFGAFSLKDFATKVATVRGEFQQLEQAFTAMLGSKAKSDKLMNQLIKTAATTPFDMQQVAASAKQLLAYGVQADKVNGTLKRLGDIAAGLSIPMGDLAYLYGTTMVQGRMYTMDLNQFLNRGIPLTEELAKQFGVTKDKVKELVTAGKVGFPQVEKAIIAMTSKGGRFYKQMESQSKTITGQLSNLGDSIQQMFNEIGKSSEGTISTAISGASTIVSHWREIGTVILNASVAFGTYKAAMIAINVVQAIHNRLLAEAALQQKLAAMQGIVLSDAQALAAVKTTLLSRAMQGLKLAIASNPLGVILTVIATATTAFMLYKERTDDATKAQNSLNKIQSEAAQRTSEQTTKIDLLIRAAKNEKLTLDQRKRAIQQLNKIIPRYNAHLDATTGKYIANANALSTYLSQLQRKYELEGAKDKLREIGKKRTEARVEYEKGQRDAIKANPYSLDNKVKQKIVYGGAATTIVVANKDKRIAAKKRVTAAYNEKMAAVKAEEDAIMAAYGEDLQKEATRAPRKTTPAPVPAATTGGGSKKRGRKTKAATTGSSRGDSKKNAAEERKRIEEEIAARKREIKKYEQEVIEQDKEAELDIRQKRIEGMKESNARQRAQIELNYDKLIYENGKRLDEMKKALADKRLNEYLNKHPKASKKQQDDYKDSLLDPNSINKITVNDLQKQQIDQLLAYQDIAAQQRDAALQKLQDDQLKHEAASLESYTKDFGDFLQRKYLLTKQAKEKIDALWEDKDTTRYDKLSQTMSIQGKLDKELKQIDFEKLKKDLNWDIIFSDLQGIAPEALETVKQQLQDFADTAKDLPVDQIKIITEALQKLQDNIDLSTPIRAIKQAGKAYKEASKAYNEFAVQYSRSEAKGDKTGMQKASQGMVAESEKMSKAANRQRKAINKTIEVIDEFAKTMQKAGDVAGGTAGDLLKFAGAAVLAGTSLVKSIKAFGEAAGAIDKTIAVLAIIRAVLEAINLISDFFGDKGSSAGFNAYVEAMKSYIDMLNKSISELNESMKDVKNSISETLAFYDKLTSKARESADAIKKQSIAALLQRKSGEHSQGYNIKKKILEGVEDSNAAVREYYFRNLQKLNDYFYKVHGRYIDVFNEWKDVGRMDWLWGLSDEEIEKLSKDTELMSILGDDLAGAITNYVQKIKELKKIKGDADAAILRVPWQQFYDDFVNIISDMDKKSEDFAHNFGNYIRKALIANLVASTYKQKLDELYKRAAALAKAGELNKDNVALLQAEYQKIADDARKRTEIINDITGYNEQYQQQASYNSISNISFEQASSIISLTTAGNITRDQIRELTADISTGVSKSLSIATTNSALITELRDISLNSCNYLDDIARYTRSIYHDFSNKIDDISRTLKEAF